MHCCILFENSLGQNPGRAGQGGEEEAEGEKGLLESRRGGEIRPSIFVRISYGFWKRVSEISLGL